MVIILAVSMKTENILCVQPILDIGMLNVKIEIAVSSTVIAVTAVIPVSTEEEKLIGLAVQRKISMLNAQIHLIETFDF